MHVAGFSLQAIVLSCEKIKYSSACSLVAATKSPGQVKQQSHGSNNHVCLHGNFPPPHLNEFKLA